MNKLIIAQMAFFVDMLGHYNSTNRGIKKGMSYGGNACSYVAGCAIGRKIEDKALCATLDAQGDSSADKVFDMLPLDLQKLGKEFLADVQGVHDSFDNWNETGLTSEGEIEARNVANAILAGKYL